VFLTQLGTQQHHLLILNMSYKMQKLIALLFNITFITGISAFAAGDIPKKVFINQLALHPALDVTTKGIIDGLAKNGFKQNINLDIRVESAQASAALAAQIAADFVNQNPDIVVGVGTVSAQSFLKYVANNRTKAVFSTVTDPLAANLVNTLDKPGKNISGVSNFVDLEPQLQLFQALQPKLKRLGFLYNAGEMNSVSDVEKLRILCPKLGITLVEQIANKTSEVAQATAKLASSTDAIFISSDNTALAALQTVIKIANKVKIPVYVTDTDAVELGALAALGANQYQVGLQTGAMIARALNGEDLSSIPVEFPNKTELYINEKSAEIIGIIIPDNIKSKAIVIKK
jgi:putative ABC transport system substrate-binding protein